MDESVNNSIPNSSEISPLDYLIILAKHSRMILCGSAAVTLLTYLLLFISPNQYTTTASMLPPQQNMTLSAQLLNNLGGGFTSSTGGGGRDVGGFAAGLLGLKSSSDLYAAMLESNSLIDCIIARFNLTKRYKAKYLEDTRKILLKNAKISANKKNGIISIKVTDKGSKMSADIANAFIEELNNLLQRFTLQEARGRLAFLENERGQAIHNLTKAEEVLRTFSEKNSVVQIDAQTRGAIEYIARLRGEIDAKEVQIQILQKQATPFNYDVIRLETEVKGLKEKLADAETKYSNCVSDVCLPTAKAPAIGLEYLRLVREAKFQESLYLLYGRLVEIARLDMARDLPMIQVLDSGIPPKRRSNKRLLYALLVGTLSFFIMMFIPFAQEYWQQIVKDNLQKMTIISNYMEPWFRVSRNILLFNKFKRKRQ